jgi:hypothetical protein
MTHARLISWLRRLGRLLAACTLPGWLAVCIAIPFAVAEPLDKAKVPEQSQQPTQPPGSSLDDALLKDLDNELLEGAGDMKTRPKPDDSGDAAAGDKKSTAGGKSEVIDDTLPAEDADPLVHISQEMRDVEDLIPKQSSRTHAEQLQQRIVDDLSRLIDQAEAQRQAARAQASKGKKPQSTTKREIVKQPKQASGNAGKDSNKPAEDSSNRLGAAEPARPDPEQFRAMMKDTWGHLPDRDRQEVLQNTPDKFLPKYELLIEKYYKRLSEERGSR